MLQIQVVCILDILIPKATANYSGSALSDHLCFVSEINDDRVLGVTKYNINLSPQLCAILALARGIGSLEAKYNTKLVRTRKFPENFPNY